MQDFLDELRTGLRRCQVCNERVLVAVSGGADSVALLCGIYELADEFELEIQVAHLNHGLRGAESDADADWVRQLTTSFDLPCEVGLISDRRLNLQSGGLEETARQWRHQFFDEVAAKFGCRSIALAHTANDQSETVLHRFLRGTGVTGLRGMVPIRNTEKGHRLVRPLLSISRSTLESYLQNRGQAFRQDSTNLDTAMTRNRIRHLILPLLREQINPQVDSAICRLAEQANAIEELIRDTVEKLTTRVLKDSQPDSCRIDVRELTDQSRFIACEVFREIWLRQHWPQQAMGSEQWNRLAETVHSRETFTLPNRIEARYHSEYLLVLQRLSSLG